MSDTRPCEECGAKMEFIMGPNGKFIPAQRVKTVYVVDESSGLDKLVKLALPDVALYVSHFETCPNPGRFSKKAGK
jgi:hypothetical protein